MEIELEDGIYQAKDNIGQGCFGQVKLLVHISTKKKLALKIIDLVTESKTELAYAELEAELLKELSANPIILKYVHHLKSDRQFFLITEYIEGRTLSRDIGNLTMQEAIRIYKQILLGLEFIHGKGICHRDIKPANIMITIQGVLKLIDFGLAERFIDENGEEIMFDHCEGSREHLPPETQTEGECRCHGPSHDIWSSGVVFVECITGLSPWKKADPEEDENYRAWKNNSLTSFWDAIVSAELIPLLRKVLSESIKRPSARKILDWLAETIKQEHKEEGSGLEPSSETRSIKLSDDLEEAFENVDEAENRSGSRDRKRKRSRSRDDDRKKRKSSRDRKRSS